MAKRKLAPPTPRADMPSPPPSPCTIPEDDDPVELPPRMTEHERKYLAILWRAFDHACQDGIKDPDLFGPNPLQLAAAMLMSPGYDETELPISWTTFCKCHPFHAILYRRSVSGLMFKGRRLNPVIEEAYKLEGYAIAIVVPDDELAKQIVKKEFYQVDVGKPVMERLQLLLRWPNDPKVKECALQDEQDSP